MKTIKIDDVMYSLPSSWNDITIAKQIKAIDLNKSISNENIRILALVSAYADIPLDELKSMNVNRAKRIVEAMSFLQQPIPNIKEPIKEFTFKGQTYYIAQNLMNQEFQDYVSWENILQQYKDEQHKAMNYLIAILAKRKKSNGELESMDDYDVNERAKEFEELSITIAERIKVFFWNAGKISNQISLLSSPVFQETLIQKKIEEIDSILNKQVGRGLLMKLQVGILKMYMWFIKRQLRKYFTTIQQ